MSNGMQRDLSQRKKVKSALERIDSLEEQFPEMLRVVENALVDQAEKTMKLHAMMEAVVELFGPEVVDAKIKELSESKALKRLADAQLALAQGVERGEVVKTEKINEHALIVGRESTANGEAIFPGRVQLQFEKIKPTFQKQLLNQTAGFTFETENGGKFEVLEVYEVLPPKRPDDVPAEAVPADVGAAVAPEVAAPVSEV